MKKFLQAPAFTSWLEIPLYVLAVAIPLTAWAFALA